MYRIIQLALACCLALCGAGCKPNAGSSQATGEQATVGLQAATDTASIPTVTYARGFRISPCAGGIRLVDIQDPQTTGGQLYRFALVPRGVEPSGVPDGYTVVRTPVRSIICMTSLQLSNFLALGACDRVTGITSTRHLFNETMQRQLAAGQTVKIGIEGNFDSELVMSMAPDIIFISPFKRGGYEGIMETGIPLVPHLGYKEMTPLGQAEWVKLVGLFIGMEQEAGAKFAAIEQRYKTLAAQADSVQKRPVVFSGELRGGNWYAVGGQSFLAQLFRDAGADYFLKDDPRSGGVTLDFETVYSQADKADFWRIVNSYEGTFSYDALKSMDPRYADFRAFRERGIIYCNMREKPFYETMPMQPDVVLADLIHVFHPRLLPADYQPVYYERLK